MTGLCADVQDLQGASEAFTVILDLSDASHADRLAATSNRAACHLAQGQYSSTVADCNLAFDLLTGEQGKAPRMHDWLSSEGITKRCTSPQINTSLLLPRLVKSSIIYAH